MGKKKNPGRAETATAAAPPGGADFHPGSRLHPEYTRLFLLALSESARNDSDKLDTNLFALNLRKASPNVLLVPATVAGRGAGFVKLKRVGCGWKEDAGQGVMSHQERAVAVSSHPTAACFKYSIMV